MSKISGPLFDEPIEGMENPNTDPTNSVGAKDRSEPICRYNITWVNENGVELYEYTHDVVNGYVLDLNVPINNGVYDTSDSAFHDVVDVSKGTEVNKTIVVKYMPKYAYKRDVK